MEKKIKFKITSKYTWNLELFFAEDFGFKGYYPLLSKESFSQIYSRENSSTIYVDNLYDKLQNNNFYEDEGENYYIYIFDSEKDNLPIFKSEKYIISESVYFDNILPPININEFKIIPGNSNGSIIFNIINKQELEYYFYTCKNNEIKFKLENSNGFFLKIPNYYLYEKTINENGRECFPLANIDEILSPSFVSNNEFIFLFSLNELDIPYCYNNKDFSIVSIYGLLKNIIQIKFTSIYKNCESQYYLIIAKTNELYNNESFSVPCYLLKLFNENSTNSILIKPIYENNSKLIVNTVNISQLNAYKNSELIAILIDFKNNYYDYYKPLEFILKQKNIKEFKLEEIVEFDFNEKKKLF